MQAVREATISNDVQVVTEGKKKKKKKEPTAASRGQRVSLITHWPVLETWSYGLTYHKYSKKCKSLWPAESRGRNIWGLETFVN